MNAKNTRSAVRPRAALSSAPSSTLTIALTFALAAALVLATLLPAPALAGPGSKPKSPELKVTVTQDPSPGKAGQPVTVKVAVEPPTGIKLNQYPGITLKVTGTDGLTLASPEAFVGTKKPIADPAQFGFKHIDPLELKATGGKAGTRTMDGTLTFFYCVIESGYCAPGEMKLRIPVTLK